MDNLEFASKLFETNEIQTDSLLVFDIVAQRRDIEFRLPKHLVSTLKHRVACDARRAVGSFEL